MPLKFIKIGFLFILFYCSLNYSQQFHILESTNDHIKIEFDFNNSYKITDTVLQGKTFQYIVGKSFPLRKTGEPWLPAYYINLGVPINAVPQVKIISVDQIIYPNKFILPTPEDTSIVKIISLNNLDRKVYGTNALFPASAANIIDDYTFRYLRTIILNTSPFQFNPVSRELIRNIKIIVEVLFGMPVNSAGMSIQKINDSKTLEFINNNIANKKEALTWIGYLKTKSIQNISSQNYWYNPNKNYYEIYLKQKGVYRISYDQLVSSGILLNQVPLNKLELINEGSQVPILITDSNNNGIFDSGDYFEFVGYPPKPTPYCNLNIYNNDNVYFFSVQADSSGLRYTEKDGYPKKWDYTYQTSYEILHFEKDSLFENLGYAGDDKRDFWFWDNAYGNNGSSLHDFEGRFDALTEMDPDSTHVNVKVGLQGLTVNNTCTYDHNAYISLTDQPIGNIRWDGQNNIVFNKTIKVSNDSIHIYPTGNLLQVKVTGDACPVINSDEIAINWFELGYWKDNRADTNHFEFSNPPNINGQIKFWIWRWLRDSLKIFIPQTGELIKNVYIPKDQYNSIMFVDSVFSSRDYFCVGYDYFLTPDSITDCVKSDLRSTSNGADYIIIAHPDFKSVAEQLASFRQSNFPDTSIVNPRIKIVYVNQIYNEFSNGLLDPNSLRDFVGYAFQNWQKPSPAYVVLLGDMSHDYRHLLSASRPSFVPSIPFYSYTLGESISDNLIAAVLSDSIHPDLAIGRLSCESVSEGNILVNKLMNYPQDNTKAWKQNVLLVSSGLSLQDEISFGLNEASMQLKDSYLTPNGINSTEIMTYPDQPEYLQYQGSGPEIRNAINQGAALVNYYGHGGGYQWDLTFLNDDISMLNNGGKLPLILSVTCYTADFDNLDVFGEQFNKAEGKGSIGFFGNVGLTYWNIGSYIDDQIFSQIFNKRNFISGKVFQFAKNTLPAIGYNISQIALLTYLGDPVFKLDIPDKPDFVVNSSDISFEKSNGVVNDTINVKTVIHNLGVNFPGDSVYVQLFIQSVDTSYELPSVKLPSFGIADSTYFTWIPNKAGNYTISLKVNEKKSIPELDLSDNTTSSSFVIYNLDNPNIIYPVDGFSSQNNFVDFRIADLGYYISNSLKYLIEIDTSINFASPITSGPLTPINAVVNWRSPALSNGVYFWRSRIYNGVDSSNWSNTRTFFLSGIKQNEYFYSGKELNLYQSYNMNPSDSGLVLNTNYLPPKPDNNSFIENISISSPVLDTTSMTAITTDGTYFYYGSIWYYAINNNVQGCSKIYKIGTGQNGTIIGKFYGSIPNFFAPIKNSIFFYSDGYLYVATGDPHTLLRVDKNTGDTLRVFLNAGMLNSSDAKVENGFFYLTADSNYVYNITTNDSLGNNHYILRTFNPAKNWQLVKNDMQLTGTSYQGFSGFFVADNYIYPYENFNDGSMRRIRLSDGVFESDWITYQPFQGYYTWCYDAVNNLVYASVFHNNYSIQKIAVFKGKYLDANGYVSTNDVGPAKKWNSLNYIVSNNHSQASFKVLLLGKNTATDQYDTLNANLPNSFNISGIDPVKYQSLKLSFNFWDSSFASVTPLKLKNVSLDYIPLPDISIVNNDIQILPDSLLQGLPINIKFNIHNIGLSSADSASIKLFLNSSNDPFYFSTVSIPADSSIEVISTINSKSLVGSNKVLAQVKIPGAEYYTFNNNAFNNFYVIRDSTKPAFTVTFDGKEILNGDIVSAKPKVIFTLKDNGALPIDTSSFLISFDNNNFNFNSPSVKFSTSPYPDSKAIVSWNPNLSDGKHTISYLAKDPSGNYSDSTAKSLEFYTYNQGDVINVFNFPNPFKDYTTFTFQLTGVNVPDEFTIKIFTVAGRLIKSIIVPPSELQIGFNKIYWDGRDEDGDLLANGVYFYKFITKINGIAKTVIQKMAKVK